MLLVNPRRQSGATSSVDRRGKEPGSGVICVEKGSLRAFHTVMSSARCTRTFLHKLTMIFCRKPTAEAPVPRDPGEKLDRLSLLAARVIERILWLAP